MATEACVLVVCGDSQVRRSISQPMTQAGYAVVEARTGYEGLRLATEHQPALILLDSLVTQ